MVDHLKNSVLPRALSEVVADLANLFEKEVRLARAELSEKLSLKIQAGIWMSAAAVLGIVAALVAVEAAVFGIASAFGIALHWSCLIVAAVLAALAAAAYAKGRANAEEGTLSDTDHRSNQSGHSDSQGATQMTYHSRDNGAGMSERLLGSLRQNPEGLLLLAAGAVLLMRKGTSSARSPSIGTMDTRSHADYRAVRSEIEESGPGVVQQVKETASSIIAPVSGYVGEAGRVAKNANSSVRGSIERIVQEQPLLIAAAGLAAGACIAAAFPATGMERQTLGPIGDQLSDAASRVGEQLQEATVQAGERLKSAAQERGLNTDGIKEVVTEAANAFGDSMSGKKNEGAASSSQFEQPGFGQNR